MIERRTKDEKIVLHAPEGTQLAIELAAIRAQVRPSEFLRRIVLDGLEANGFQLSIGGETPG